ncbi:glucoside xylosyltransferase 1 isoform X1 [Bacillus rossius redtenbacheri]|uniref:glucoside xylosyltransferase 1 isoform X1 n=1 Tax=Bacillus rossius redtenbacheri TaxID=93214 RepID=UPI002FDD943C
MKSILRFLVVVIILCALVFCFYARNLMQKIKFKLDNNHNNNRKAVSDMETISNPDFYFAAKSKGSNVLKLTSNFKQQEPQIVLAAVACGDRLAETLTMIKSAIVFSRSLLKFFIFADDPLIPSFKEKLNEWRGVANYSFAFEVRPITFPLQGDTGEWRRLFKPCASQRLFLPTLLPQEDALLYVDTDTLFLGPLRDVWDHFRLMNASQMAALSPEHEEPNAGWYNRFARHPYYGKLGVNSGVMLMNLTRMRAFSWTDYVVPVYKEYKLRITWGDQDIINIIFHFHPGELYVYSCRYNYRPDHCMYMSVCRSAEQQGVAVLHGSRGSFHAEKQPAFRAVYRAFEEYQLGSDQYANLYLPMKNYLESTAATNCGKLQPVFTRNMQRFLQSANAR